MRTQGAGAGKPRRMLPSPISRPAPDEGAAKPFKLEIIDLDAHPDGKLLRACAQATKIRDIGTTTASPGQWRLDRAPPNYWQLVHFICETEALTPLGITMKAIFVMDDRPDPDQHSPASLYASVIRDFLRMGVPA